MHPTHARWRSSCQLHLDTCCKACAWAAQMKVFKKAPLCFIGDAPHIFVNHTQITLRAQSSMRDSKLGSNAKQQTTASNSACALKSILLSATSALLQKCGGSMWCMACQKPVNNTKRKILRISNLKTSGTLGVGEEMNPCKKHDNNRMKTWGD